MSVSIHQAAAEFLRCPNLAKITVDLGDAGVVRLTRDEVAGMMDAPHGWIWLDDDGWEHNPNPQHPRLRGEAEYGSNFRAATAEEAVSPDFLRAGNSYQPVTP